MKLKIVQYFAADFEVEVMKLNLGRDSDARLGQDFGVWVKPKCWCLVDILKLMLCQDSEDERVG